jgi:hypothetical protein
MATSSEEVSLTAEEWLRISGNLKDEFLAVWQEYPGPFRTTGEIGELLDRLWDLTQKLQVWCDCGPATIDPTPLMEWAEASDVWQAFSGDLGPTTFSFDPDENRFHLTSGASPLRSNELKTLIPDMNEILSCYNNARRVISRIRAAAPSVVTGSPTAARNEWLYNERVNTSKTWGEIQSAFLAQCEEKGWRLIRSPVGMKKAADEHARINALTPLPDGRTRSN